MKLDYGNCEVERLGGKEACVKRVSLRTGTVYEAVSAGELAQHNEALCSVLKVKTEVVRGNNMLLPGEALLPCDCGLNLPVKDRGTPSNGGIEQQGVSRDRSSYPQRAGVLGFRMRVAANRPEVSVVVKDRTAFVQTTGGDCE